MEAIEAIAADEPDLVLLDIEMPLLDGLEVCRRIKAHPTQRLIPVVLITALTDRESPSAYFVAIPGWLEAHCCRTSYRRRKSTSPRTIQTTPGK